MLLRKYETNSENFKKIRAMMILITATQTVQLIAKVPIMSMSLHMAIFKQVCKTFLKTISLYLIMILAFAMSFHTLFGKSGNTNEESFSNLFKTLITTVRMMLSNFEDISDEIEKDYFTGFLFLTFVVLITIVLLNLINALAISDTHNIIKNA